MLWPKIHCKARIKDMSVEDKQNSVLFIRIMRWNNLLFLWGAFKGRKANCSNSSKSVCNPDASMVPLERQISAYIPQPVDNESAACDSTCNVVLATTAVEKTCISTDSVSNNKVSSLEQTYGGTKAKLEEQDDKADPKLLSRIAKSSTEVHSKVKCTSSLEESKIPDCRFDPELKACRQATKPSTGSLKVEEEMRIEEDYPSLKDRPTGKQEAVVEEKVDGDFVKIRDSKDDGHADGKTSSNSDLDYWRYYPSLKDRLTGKQEAIFVEKVDGGSVKIRDSKDGKASANRDIDRWQLNQMKCPYIDLTEPASEVSTVASQTMPWSEGTRVSIDRGNGNKKLNTGFSGIYQYSNARDQVVFSDSLASNRHNPGSGSSVEEKRCDIPREEKIFPEDQGSSKRFFFPVDSHCAGENSKPWKELSVKDEYRVHDVSPNLELALGAETKPPNKGTLPFFVGAIDKRDNQNKLHNKETRKPEDDDVSASLSLSLSLSFPFPEREREQQLSERHPVNTSLLLFRGFPEN